MTHFIVYHVFFRYVLDGKSLRVHLSPFYLAVARKGTYMQYNISKRHGYWFVIKRGHLSGKGYAGPDAQCYIAIEITFLLGHIALLSSLLTFRYAMDAHPLGSPTFERMDDA